MSWSRADFFNPGEWVKKGQDNTNLSLFKRGTMPALGKINEVNDTHVSCVGRGF